MNSNRRAISTTELRPLILAIVFLFISSAFTGRAVYEQPGTNRALDAALSVFTLGKFVFWIVMAACERLERRG